MTQNGQRLARAFLNPEARIGTLPPELTPEMRQQLDFLAMTETTVAADQLPDGTEVEYTVKGRVIWEYPGDVFIRTTDGEKVKVQDAPVRVIAAPVPEWKAGDAVLVSFRGSLDAPTQNYTYVKTGNGPRDWSGNGTMTDAKLNERYRRGNRVKVLHKN